ncbi:hypothetical protein KAR48_16575 [bacterium]|nr:hypothetical protein [bacterium]
MGCGRAWCHSGLSEGGLAAGGSSVEPVVEIIHGVRFSALRRRGRVRAAQHLYYFIGEQAGGEESDERRYED